MEKGCAFEFSVIMAVYNTEPFLREAVESLVTQDFGFEKIQLIMVDDGSTDGSGAICDEYAERYPANVVVIHKENGGQSSARNRGVKAAAGRYLNFLDSDDWVDRTTFSAVHRFFTKHEGETDIVSIPIILFGKKEGKHPANGSKFRRGNRVIDLETEWSSIQMSLASSFIKAEAAKGLCFQEDLTMASAEDTRELLKILLHKPALGVVADACYHYRKHDGSTLANKDKTPLAYIPYLQDFSQWAFQYAREQRGYIPKYIQSVVMYDLQWKIKAKTLPVEVLGEEGAKSYAALLKSLFSSIDDDVIVAQRNLFAEQKTWLLEQKHGEPMRLLQWRRNAFLTLDNVAWFSLAQNKLCLEFLRIENGACEIEGYATIYPAHLRDVQVQIDVNGTRYPCETAERHKHNSVLDEPVSYRAGFRASFPLRREDESYRVKVFVVINGIEIQVQNLTAGEFFPVSREYKNSYDIQEHWRISVTKGYITIGSCGRKGRLISECLFLKELWKRNALGGRKAVLSRLAYHVLKRFKRKPIWLVSDRIEEAGDNGEAFFHFMRSEHREIRTIFVLRKNSKDYARLKKAGPVVSPLSLRHKLLHLLCDCNISSQASPSNVNPFYGYHDGYRNILVRKHFIFLQHGIILSDLSGWLNRYNRNIEGFVTSARLEYDSIVNGDYDYPEERVWLTGLPRFDRLYQTKENIITIMPTWRRYLMGSMDNETGVWELKDDFYTSDYYRFFSALLNHARLLDAAKKYGYKIQFFPHPNIRPHMSVFTQNESVSFEGAQTEYRDIYARSSLIVTDYSSAVFDFAYLLKPVIYSQFDSEDFFSGKHTSVKGYFDFEQDGFGEVEYDLEGTVDRMIEYMENGCRLKDKYRERVGKFFAFNDQNNCHRVYEKILALE